MDDRRFCDPELARAHIVIQEFTHSFSPMEALDKGTLFPELYCPYKYREDKYDKRREGRSYESYEE